MYFNHYSYIYSWPFHVILTKLNPMLIPVVFASLIHKKNVKKTLLNSCDNVQTHSDSPNIAHISYND